MLQLSKLNIYITYLYFLLKVVLLKAKRWNALPSIVGYPCYQMIGCVLLSFAHIPRAMFPFYGTVNILVSFCNYC